MLTEALKVSILYGTGNPYPTLLDLIQNASQAQLIQESTDPEEFVSQQQGKGSDLVMVFIDGDHSLPDWLETLTNSLPQTTVLLCADNMEPGFLLKAMRLGVKEVLPLPLSQEDLAEALVRVRTTRKRLSEIITTQGKMLVVTGNKGGVGSTTVAVNLAVSIAAAQSGRVVLMDLGRPYPDVGNFLDRESMYTLFDLLQNQANLDNAFLDKIVQPYEQNLSIVHGISDFQEQDNIHQDGLKKVFTILRTSFRWIVVDLSHWLDDLFLQVVQEADQVLMVVELSVPDLRNLGHLWPLLKNWEHVQEKVKLVVNRYDKGNGLNLRNLEQVLKQKAYFTLPSDFTQVNEAINRGIPLGKVAPKSKLWLSLEELSQQLVSEVHRGEELEGPRPKRRFWVF